MLYIFVAVVRVDDAMLCNCIRIVLANIVLPVYQYIHCLSSITKLGVSITMLGLMSRLLVVCSLPLCVVHSRLSRSRSPRECVYLDGIFEHTTGLVIRFSGRRQHWSGLVIIGVLNVISSNNICLQLRYCYITVASTSSQSFCI